MLGKPAQGIRMFPLLLGSILMTGCVTGGNIDLSIRHSSSEASVSSSEAPTGPFRVLFVGNSFTYYNNIPTIAENIGKSLGLDIQCDSVTKGSQRLIDTANSSDEIGAKFDAALKNRYTHIVLQEQSTAPVNSYDRFKQGVEACLGKIRASQDPQCKVYLYGTWAYSSMCSSEETIPQAEARLRAAYATCGQETGLPVTSVGTSFSYCYQNNSDINLYHTDNKHPSYAGSFLSAATHVASMFGVDVTKNEFTGTPGKYEDYGTQVLQDIDSATASKLEDIANRVSKGQIK